MEAIISGRYRVGGVLAHPTVFYKLNLPGQFRYDLVAELCRIPYIRLTREGATIMLRAIMHAWACADEDLRREALVFLVAGLRAQADKAKMLVDRRPQEKQAEENPRLSALSQSLSKSDKR